jgi:hypothetical protein
MYRRIACPGSAHIDNKDTPSISADEGTAAHAEAADVLRGTDFLHDLKNIKLKYDIRPYIDYIRSLEGTLLLIESKVILGSISNEIYGTADCIVIDWTGVLHIIDLKYGIRNVIEPTDNAQLATYGLGALEKFQEDFDEIWLTIVQPRIPHKEGVARSWKTTSENLKKVWHKKIKKAYELALEKPKLYRDGDHCKWCSGAMECTKAQNQTNTIIRAQKKGVTFSADNKKLGRILSSEQMVLEYFNLAKTEAFRRLQAGNEIPGFKIVQSVGNTTWLESEEEVIKDLGLSPTINPTAFNPSKLRTPKQLKEAGYSIDKIDALTHRPKKGLILVSEKDKRPQYRKAYDDFDDELSQKIKGEKIDDKTK